MATQLDSVFYFVVEGGLRLHIVKDGLSRFPGCRPLACCGGDGVRLGAAAGVGIPGRRKGVARVQHVHNSTLTKYIPRGMICPGKN